MSSEEVESSSDVREWFKGQWGVICEAYPNDLREGRLDRFHQMFKILIGETVRVSMPPLQSPYSFYLPGITTKPFHDPAFYWAKMLEDNYPEILEELHSVMGSPKFEEYVGDGVQEDKGLMTEGQGEWKVLYFYHNFVRQEETCKSCPKTAQLIDSIPEFLRGMVCFSAIEPGTHILPHFGPSNMRLTAHLGLLNCKNVEVTVGKETHCYEDGKVIVFDDSFRHEVRHKGNGRRVTLMLDVWHPDLLPVEIEVFQMVMRNSVGTIDQDKFYHSLHLFSDEKRGRFRKNSSSENSILFVEEDRELDPNEKAAARAEILKLLFSLSEK